MREKGHRRGAKNISLSIDKTPNHETAIITSEDTGETLLHLEIEPSTHRLIVAVKDGAPVEVTNAATGEIIVQRATAGDKDPEGLRTWSISDDGLTFKCWLPNGNAIELPIEESPGEFTPTEFVPEVLGQPELIFAIALGIKLKKHTLLTGPTGIAKTTAYRWMAKTLNYNLILMPVARGTESAHMVGEYMPADDAGHFAWTDGPVTQAARLSATHKTLLVFDEVNRIGNIAEFARVYSLLDDTRMLELKEKRTGDTIERIYAEELYVGATSNPSDSEGGGDYIGVQDLDPALNSRFGLQPPLAYPQPEIEAAALMKRVPGLQKREADAMVATAKRIREATNVRFPISFRELVAWAETLPFFGWKQAAEISVISKAAASYRPDLRQLIQLQTNSRPAA